MELQRKPRSLLQKKTIEATAEPRPARQRTAPAAPAAPGNDPAPPLATSVNILRADPGIYVLQIGALDRPSREISGMTVPVTHIGSPARNGAAVEIVASYPQRGPWIGCEGGTAVVNVPAGGGQIVVTSYGEPDLLGGVVVDRTRRPDLAIVLGCLLTAFAIVAIPLLGVPVVWLLLSGVVVGLAPGALVALVPGSVPPAQLAAALGLFYAAFYLGMAAMQPLAGLLRDITGSPAALLFFAAATMVLTVVALGAFRRIERRRVTSPRP